MTLAITLRGSSISLGGTAAAGTNTTAFGTNGTRPNPAQLFAVTPAKVGAQVIDRDTGASTGPVEPSESTR